MVEISEASICFSVRFQLCFCIPKRRHVSSFISHAESGSRHKRCFRKDKPQFLAHPLCRLLVFFYFSFLYVFGKIQIDACSQHSVRVIFSILAAFKSIPDPKKLSICKVIWLNNFIDSVRIMYIKFSNIFPTVNYTYVFIYSLSKTSY